MGQRSSSENRDLSELALELSQSLLDWWAVHGRTGIPWKSLPSGARLDRDQELDTYGIWIAEVMLCSAA